MKYDTGLDLKQIASEIESYLATQNIIGKITDIVPGPLVSTFRFTPESGFKLPKTFKIGDLTLYVPHTTLIGVEYANIEIHNINRQMIWLKPLLESKEFKDLNYELPFILGVDTSGDPLYCDLAKSGNILITGDSGRGKFTTVDLISKMLFKPSKNKSVHTSCINAINNTSNRPFYIDDVQGYIDKYGVEFINVIKDAIKRNVFFIVTSNSIDLPDEFVNLFPSRLTFKTESDDNTNFLWSYGDALFSMNGRKPIRIHTPYDNE